MLKDPEPSVLADSLGAATVDVRICSWLNGREPGWLEVRSSVIHVVTRVFQEHGIPMPDEARKVVCPRGIPVTMIESLHKTTARDRPVERLPTEPASKETNAYSTKAEGRRSGDEDVLKEQARELQPSKRADNVLHDVSGSGPTDDRGRNDSANSQSRAQ